IEWRHAFDPSRKLRVGYVSAAFSNHAAAKVFSVVLLHHDPDNFEIHCYSTRRRRDSLTIKIRLAAAGWRSIAGLDDRAAVDVIRNDGIDLLVDLDGHFNRNRLGLFAMRAAPVQLSAWGYVAGPGTPGIDYLLTDSIIVPPDEDHCFSEHLMRVGCAQPYNADLLPRRPAAPSSARGGGGIRFGCFNRYDKLNQENLRCWADILRACPDATLTLKDRYIGEARLRNRILDVMARAGVAPARLRFEGAEPQEGFLAAFDRIDLALDPFPVTGGVTSLDGLSQGVPMVTLYGAEPSARIGSSILASMKLNQFIAFSKDEYVAKAIELGGAQASSPSARDTVRARFESFSNWCSRDYVRQVEAAYREIWMRTCARLGD
ncbi:MAG TPA: hypothetical protein VHW69_01155, partial [Rhizomicrobium sp.]|nr:hypothetical protein [Rhizomicrobium sp.]